MGCFKIETKTTIINITKEVIESQQLVNGFSVCVDDKGAIIIAPNNGKNPREGWAEIIKQHKTEINNDEFLQDWIAAEPYLTTPTNGNDKHLSI